MPSTEEVEIQCPFCGEPITVVVDTSEDRQDYIEDCSVCCRPIAVTAICHDGEIQSVTPSRS